MSATASPFERIVCGVDGSDESLVAARQAAALLAPGGRLTLAAIADVGAGERAPAVEQRLRDEAEAAVTRAAAAIAVHGVETVVLDGNPHEQLLSVVSDRDAGLLALGSRGAGRVVGVLLGSVTTSALHDAPCSVLVCRQQRPGDAGSGGGQDSAFPRSVVVAVDPGEPHERVLAVADELERRLSPAMRRITAVGYERIESFARVKDEVPGIEVVPELPLEAILDVSRSADLVVVGSRGTRGLRAIGSVSERVAHRARGSVLVVR